MRPMKSILRCAYFATTKMDISSIWYFSSLTAPEVVILTNSDAASDEDFVNMRVMCNTNAK